MKPAESETHVELAFCTSGPMTCHTNGPTRKQNRLIMCLLEGDCDDSLLLVLKDSTNIWQTS